MAAFRWRARWSRFVPWPGFLGAVVMLYPVWLTGAAVAEGGPQRRLRLPRAAAAASFVIGVGLHVTGVMHVLPMAPAMLYGGGAVVLCASMGAAAFAAGRCECSSIWARGRTRSTSCTFRSWRS
jgi:hypothetical protein